MEKDQIIILKNRGLISITGRDAKDFLQNIITNDINKVSSSNSIFAAILSPQGKYLYEFFVIEKNNETPVYSIQLPNHNLALSLAGNYLAELLRNDLNGSRYGRERIRCH